MVNEHSSICLLATCRATVLTEECIAKFPLNVYTNVRTNVKESKLARARVANFGGFAHAERRKGYVPLGWALGAFVRVAWLGPIIGFAFTVVLGINLTKLERDPSSNLFGYDHPNQQVPKEIEARFTGTRSATIVVVAPRDGRPISEPVFTFLRSLEPQIQALSLVHDDDVEKLNEIVKTQSASSALVAQILKDGVNAADRSSLIELAAQLSERPRRFVEELALRVRPVQRVRSLVNIEDIRAEDDLLIAEPLVKEFPKTEADYQSIEARVRSNPLYREAMISGDGKAVAMQVEFAFSNDKHPPLVVAAQKKLRALIDSQRIDEPTNLGGGPIVLAEVSRALAEDNNRLIPFALLVMVVVLGLCFRSIGGVVLTLTISTLTVVWTLGFMAWCNVPLNIISSGMPVMLLTIAVADAVHFISKVQNELSKGDARYAVSEALRVLWTPMLLTSVTTFVGFATLAITPFEFLRMAGLFTAIGAAFAWVITILFLPGTLLLIPRLAGRPRSEEVWERGPLAGFMRGLTANAGSGLVIFGLILAGSAYFASGIRVGFSNVEAFSPQSELRMELSGLTKHYKSIFPIDLMVHSTRERGLIEPDAMQFMADLEARFREHEKIGSVIGPASFVKRIHQVLVPGAQYELPSPLTRDVLGQYLLLYESGSGQEIRDYLDANYEYARITARGVTDSAVEWEPIVDDIFKFAQERAAAGVTVGGANYGYFAVLIMRDVVMSQIYNLLASMVGVGVTLALFYRSFVVAVVGLAPVAVTLTANFAWMALLGVPLDVGTAMIAAITFGVAVDYSIHILSALRETQAANWRDRVVQSVGLVSRPIVFNTIAVSMGFLVLTLASYQAIQHMGRFVAATLAISAVLALVLIPLLAFVLRPRALARYDAPALSPAVA